MSLIDESFDQRKTKLLNSPTLQSAITNQYFVDSFENFSNLVITETYGTPQLSWFTDATEMQSWLKEIKNVIGETLQESGFSDDYD